VHAGVLYYIHERQIQSVDLRSGVQHDLPKPLWPVREDARLLVVGHRLLVVCHTGSQTTLLLHSPVKWEPMASPPDAVTAMCQLSEAHAENLLLASPKAAGEEEEREE